MGKGLTPKQQMFVKEYLVDLNATQAAIRAGYSERTAAEQASRLLTNVKIAAAIQKAMDARAEKAEITAEFVLEGIVDVIRRAKSDNEKQHELKGHELLGKHLKLFTDKIDHSGTVNVTVHKP